MTAGLAAAGPPATAAEPAVLPHPGPPATAGWLPVSPCGPHCLPPARRTTPAEAVRLARRLVALVAVLASALAVVPLLPRAPRTRVLAAACRAVLRATGVRVRVRGTPAGPGTLVVAAHLSWIDVLALAGTMPVAMLAKREVRRWPLVGALAARSGAVFLDRGSLRRLPGTIAATAVALRAGTSIVVFPEGTTWCGAAAGPFRSAVFQAALDAAAPAQPVAIVLRGPDGAPAPAAAFVGDETLADALGRVLRRRVTTCEVTLLPPLAPSGTRRELAGRAAAAITSVSGVPHRSRPRRRTVAIARGHAA